ncbi:flagellar hook protein 3 [Thermacetogenium phaeum DSM 12270]|uniref:Flagellar hook protein 3 n=1 Tax=Thermacetogenium phaeum (strain ATCC BAA-254 / DSM 26808 / PB) TaxID=1089553 RepID=K4LFH4_THEPS|nr:flagellar hook-associated protein FlgL [Thermacetogenium phaeum]AFV10807.1 flagellar hook protein 3 [Thermacetogenium phaeum DSM 12270]
MRVTNQMISNNLLRCIHTNLSELERAQDRLASGREIRRPSDDPVRAVIAMGLRAGLGETVQYQSNIQDALSWLEVTEGALAGAIEVLQRARDLAVQGATDTLPQESRDALKKEVEQLKEQLGTIANSVYGDRYIFGGTKTHKTPYDGSTWQGNGGEIKFAIAPKVEMQVNIPGMELFWEKQTSEGQTVKGAIQVLDELAGLLGDSGKTGSDISSMIGEIDRVLDSFISTRGEIGARVNRLEMSLARLEQTGFEQTDLLSRAEDADIARAIIDLKNRENAYRVTLAAGARIIMPTLIDFLR